MRELAAYLFLISLFCVSISTPIAIWLGKRWGVLDNPGPRKIHRDPIPLVGGWAIFLTLTLAVWGHLFMAYAIRGTSFQHQLSEQFQYYIEATPTLIYKVVPIYFGAAFVFLLGLIDDVRGMSVRSRLVAQIVVALGLTFFGFRPSLGFLPGIFSYAIGVLWIVGITNAFNFLDGLDGLSTGIALVGTVALLSIMGVAAQPDVVFFLATITGALLGFLRFNYHPARVFLGSSGSLLIGYLMAISTLQVTYMKGATGNWLMPLLTPIFIVAIPLYDTTSVVLIRIAQKRSIAIGDQSHFHHRLMKLGFSHRQTVAFIVIISFAIALSAVRLIDSTIWRSLLILIQICSMMSLVILAERVAAKVRGTLLERRKKERPMSAVQPSTTEQIPASPTAGKHSQPLLPRT